MPAQATARGTSETGTAEIDRADGGTVDGDRAHGDHNDHTGTGRPAGPAPAVDTAEYRRVLGHFPSGVTVVTSRDADGPVGFACQAFSALSLDPPLVMFSVAHTSTSWPRIQDTGRFCVNFLAEEQDTLCRSFAVSGGDKFDGVKWRTSPLGSPILADVHGWVDCVIETTHPGGDHTIVIGRVHTLDADAGSEPLIFHRGGFGR